MIVTSTRLPPVQRLVEIKTVAEQLHFKISTLLLHGGKVIEAITWFHQHNASYKRLVGEPEVNFLHWEWLSRQFLVFGELLETSSASIQSTSSPVLGATDKVSEWELSSAYYYQVHGLHAEPYDLQSSFSQTRLRLMISFPVSLTCHRYAYFTHHCRTSVHVSNHGHLFGIME